MAPTQRNTGKQSAKTSPIKRNSPGRKKGGTTSLKSTLAKKNAKKAEPTLLCYGTAPEIGKELYCYTVNDNNDGYTNPFRKYASGATVVPSLENAGFVSIKFRKVPGSNNLIMHDDKGYWRSVMIRNPPDGVSTAETRATGLKVLKAFFMDPTTTTYPPKDIVMSDQTNPGELHPMDNFLQDHDIIEIVEDSFEKDDLNEEFYTNFPTLALSIFGGPYYPEFARNLGYPIGHA
jgi:hypothetical protein